MGGSTLGMQRTASVVSLLASVLTLALGILYIVLSMKNSIHFDDPAQCPFFEYSCNRQWHRIFSLNPAIIFTLWTPIILGFMGIAIHLALLRFCAYLAWFLPATYGHYAVFMVITAAFGNFGYCNYAGIIVMSISLLAALIDAAVAARGALGIYDLFAKHWPEASWSER